MLSGRVATSQTAGTIRRCVHLAQVAAVVGGLSLVLTPARAQTAPFSAAPVIFAASGDNSAQTQTVAVQLSGAVAIKTIAIAQGFKGAPDFTFVQQTGCKVDGSTVNAAGTTCSVLVRFRPQGPGLRHGSLMVIDAGGNSFAVGLTGTGYFAQAAMTPGAVSIVAGLGPSVAAYSGDGDVAADAGVSAPTGVAADSFGNIFFSDTGNNVVRMLDAFGNVTTVAGGGSRAGLAGDGGAATSAMLVQPTYVAVDSAGNLYIAESGSNVVRRVTMSASKTITTVAGNYTAGFSDGVAATAGQLNNPQGLVVDGSGVLYIADSGNQRIRRVDPLTGVISTFAGSSSQAGTDSSTVGVHVAHFNGPTGVAIDGAGDLFVSDAGNHAVRMIAGNVVSVVVGTGVAGNTGDGGVATAATLKTPAGLAVSPGGDLYIVDTEAGVVRKVQASDGVIETVAGEAKDAGSYTAGVSPATSTRMNGPMGLAFDTQQNLYVTDTGNNVVRRVSTAPAELRYAAQAPGNTSSPLTLELANIGNAPLTVVSVAAANMTTSNNYVLNNSGSAPCAASLAGGAHCAFTVAFGPQAAGFVAGEIDVMAQHPTNASFNDTLPVYLVGGAMAPLAIGPDTLPNVVAGQNYSSAITASGGFGAIHIETAGSFPPDLNTTVNGAELDLSGKLATVGTYAFTVYAMDALGEAIDKSYSLTVLPALVSLNLNETVSVNDSVLTLPMLKLSIQETVHTTDTETPLLGLVLGIQEVVHVSDTTVEMPSLSLSIIETVTINDAVNNSVGKVSQSINAPTFSDHSYGDTAFSIGLATSTSGLPVSVAVSSGPAVLTNRTLDLTGSGTVVLTYTQAGSTDFEEAPAVTRTFNVLPAILTVTAVSVSRAFEQLNPALTYMLSGFVHGDTPPVIGGAPALSTAATLNSPAGTYPISIGVGTLASPNYAFSLLPGAITISGHVAQTITFAAFPSHLPLTLNNLTLSAHSTSTLAITYTVSGPATITGKGALHLTGAGLVTVTASQPGNTTFDPATPVSRSFTVTP